MLLFKDVEEMVKKASAPVEAAVEPVETPPSGNLVEKLAAALDDTTSGGDLAMAKVLMALDILSN